MIFFKKFYLLPTAGIASNDRLGVSQLITEVKADFHLFGAVRSFPLNNYLVLVPDLRRPDSDKLDTEVRISLFYSTFKYYRKSVSSDLCNIWS